MPAPKMNRTVKADENTFITMKRLLGYVFKNYKFHCFLTMVFIVISALATVASSLFTKNLIDQYIMELLTVSHPSFVKLFRALCMMACIYIIGTISTYLYNKILIEVCQGTLKDVRNDLFEHMQKLPIAYFDTHAHGDIMSVYTNDTDTLRQMISQSIPQLFSSCITIVSVFISMLILSVPLSFVVVIMVLVMKKVTTVVAGKSAVYFGQ